ncbi:MAG: hypothetical protein K2K82_03660 [Muribaculaceae bacterium]|nr:hypothetical protein [Muribaculaceae bacterium]
MKRISILAAAALIMGVSAQAAPSVPKIHRAQASGMLASVKSAKENSQGRKLAPVSKKRGIRRAPSMNVPGPTEAQNHVITEAPAGKRGYYAKQGNSWGNEYGFWVYQTASDGCVADIVLTDDNKIYMAPAFSEGVADYGTTYIVGDVKDGVATFTFPQAVFYGPVYDEDYNIIMDYDYALMMEYVEDDEGYYDLVPSSKQTISFNIAEDGTLTPTVEDPDTYVAAAWWYPDDAETSDNTYGGWTWGMLADNYTSLTPVKETPTVLPEGVTAEQWNVIEGKQGYAAGVAISGSDIYICGLYPGLPEGVIAGKIEGNKAVFPSVTYLGVDESTYYMAYAQSAEWVEYEDPDYGLMEGLVADGKEIVFDYDAAAGKLSSEGSIVFSMIPDGTIALSMGLQNPLICKASGKEITEINKPFIVEYMPYDDENAAGYIGFTIHNVVNGTDVIPADKLYFSIYMNDELLAFDPETYLCFDKDETEVPYGFTDETESMAIEYDMNYNAQFVAFIVDGISTIGVQAIYKDGDKVVKSEIVTINGEEPYEGEDDSIKEIIASGAVTGIFDLQGRKLVAPVKGINIINGKKVIL